MKKILFLILLITNVCAYSQTYIRSQLRWVRVGGVWQLQEDSASNNNWRAFATREYVQGYVFSHPPTVNNLSDIPNRPFGALQSIPSTIAGYGISDAANKSTTMTASFGLIGGGDLSANRDFKVDTTHSSIGISTYLYLRHISDSLSNLISAAGGGTVLSVSRTNGYGISASVADSSVNPNITIAIDSATLALYFPRRKDSSVAGGYYPYSSNPKGYLISSDVSGTYVPLTRTVNGKALSSNITLGLASSDFANQGTTTTVLHGNAAGNPSFSQIVNADVSNSAAIAYSKLNLTGSIVNADISSSAAIAYSKLNLGGSILNGDITNGTIDLTAKVTNSLPVANGGTGKSSLTAYAILAGGTTSTGAMQQVSGLGSSGQVLTSNGAGALPTWQTAPGTQNFYYQNMVNADSSFVLRNDSTLLSKAYIVTPNSGRIRQVAHTYQGDSVILEPIDVNVGNLGTGTPSATKVLAGDSSWKSVDLTTMVTGVLPIANGGTNISTYATGDILYASATNTLSKLSSPAANRLLGFDNTDGIPAYITIGSNLSYDHATHTLSASSSGSSAIINSSIDWVLADSAMGVVNKGQVVGLNLQTATTAGNLTDARANFVAVWVNADTTINGVAFYMVTQGDYNADQNNYAALYSYSSSTGTLTQIAISANDTALWKTATANTFASATFTTPVHVTRGLYFVGYLSNWASVTTTPQLKVGATASSGAIYTSGGGYPNSGKLLGFISSRNTLPASQAMSGVTVNTIMPYLRLF